MLTDVSEYNNTSSTNLSKYQIYLDEIIWIQFCSLVIHLYVEGIRQ